MVGFRAPRLIAVLAAIGATAGPATAASSPAPAAARSPASLNAAHRQAAAAQDRTTLQSLRAPGDAQRLTGEPKGGGALLARPLSVPEHGPAIDRAAFWRLAHDSLDAAVISFPLPSSVDIEMISSTQGVVHGVVRDVTETVRLPQADPGAIGTSYLAVTAARLPGGAVGVRIDAISEWNQAMPVAERVPAAATELDFAQVRTAQPVSVQHISNPATIADFARSLDALPVAATGFFCPYGPESPAGSVALVFRHGPSGPPLAEYAEYGDTSPYDEPCAGSTMSAVVGGKTQPPLWGGGRVLEVAHKLIGLKLRAGIPKQVIGPL